jgi:uncharacterized integral membrane protein
MDIVVHSIMSIAFIGVAVIVGIILLIWLAFFIMQASDWIEAQ